MMLMIVGPSPDGKFCVRTLHVHFQQQTGRVQSTRPAHMATNYATGSTKTSTYPAEINDG